MSWDQDPQVPSPVGQSIETLLREGPRRQSLDGFEPVYRDIVDYIIRCTHRIWEEKNVGLCRTHYSDDCQLHTLAGPAVGKDVVTQNTIGTLAAYPDRVVMAEDVIWSEDEPGTYYTSHRIVSHSTHAGDDAGIADATMRRGGTMTIADCKVKANRIVEEWLVRDNARALWHVGVDPRSFAVDQAAADLIGDVARHEWRRTMIDEVRGEPSLELPAEHPAIVPAAMLHEAFTQDLFGSAAEALSPAVEIRWPSNRRGFGRGYWIGCVMQLRAMLHDCSWRLQHAAARPLPDGDVAVALRWSIVGRHAGVGPWGAPSERDILLMAVSHYRIREKAVLNDTTIFDEVAALRQVAGGLGA